MIYYKMVCLSISIANQLIYRNSYKLVPELNFVIIGSFIFSPKKLFLKLGICSETKLFNGITLIKEIIECLVHSFARSVVAMS